MKLTAKMLVEIYRPGRSRKQGGYGAIISSTFPHKERSVVARFSQAWREFNASLHFLAGALNMLPYLRVPTPPTLKSDASKLLEQGYDMLYAKFAPSTAQIRRLRKHEEKIDRVLKKLEKAASKQS